MELGCCWSHLLRKHCAATLTMRTCGRGPLLANPVRSSGGTPRCLHIETRMKRRGITPVWLKVVLRCSRRVLVSEDSDSLYRVAQTSRDLGAARPACWWPGSEVGVGSAGVMGHQPPWGLSRQCAGRSAFSTLRTTRALLSGRWSWWLGGDRTAHGGPDPSAFTLAYVPVTLLTWLSVLFLPRVKEAQSGGRGGSLTRWASQLCS